MVHPAASAGAILRIAIMIGAFHVGRSPHTPTGWRSTCVWSRRPPNSTG
jgi:hypothetical protein